MHVPGNGTWIPSKRTHWNYSLGCFKQESFAVCKQLQFVKSLNTNNGASAIQEPNTEFGGYPCKNVLTLIISFVYCKLGPSVCNCIVVLCGTFILVLLDQQGTLKWQMLYVDYVRGEDAKLSGSNSILIESTLCSGPNAIRFFFFALMSTHMCVCVCA